MQCTYCSGAGILACCTRQGSWHELSAKSRPYPEFVPVHPAIWNQLANKLYKEKLKGTEKRNPPIAACDSLLMPNYIACSTDFDLPFLLRPKSPSHHNLDTAVMRPNIPDLSHSLLGHSEMNKRCTCGMVGFKTK